MSITLPEQRRYVLTYWGGARPSTGEEQTIIQQFNNALEVSVLELAIEWDDAAPTPIPCYLRFKESVTNLYATDMTLDKPRSFFFVPEKVGDATWRWQTSCWEAGLIVAGTEQSLSFTKLFFVAHGSNDVPLQYKSITVKFGITTVGPRMGTNPQMWYSGPN